MMNQRTLLLPIFILMCNAFFPVSAAGQEAPGVRSETLSDYVHQLQNSIAGLRNFTDDAGLLSQINQLDSIVVLLSARVSDAVNEQTWESISEDTFDIITEEEFVWESDDEAYTESIREEVNEDITVVEESENDRGWKGLRKKKSDVGLRIQFGINGLHSITTPPADALVPELNTGGSWYWDLGLIKKLRLGKPGSPVTLHYGATWLINRFSIENDVVFKDALSEGPAFERFTDGVKHPKFNVGYMTVPLEFHYSLGRKFAIHTGGFAGYRLLSVQKTETKTGEDDIKTQRYTDFYLNNWLYGVTAGVRLGSIIITGRYPLSGLFKENPNLNYNTFMIGTSIQL